MSQVSVTITEFKAHIQGKAELYDSMIRNGWFLPSITSTAINEVYMIGIIRGEIFCPKFEQIGLKPCPSLPTKQVLLEKLHRLAGRKKWNLGFSETTKPNKD